MVESEMWKQEEHKSINTIDLKRRLRNFRDTVKAGTSEVWTLICISCPCIYCINGKCLKAVVAIPIETAAQCITDVQETANSWMWNIIRILGYLKAQRCARIWTECS